MTFRLSAPFPRPQKPIYYRHPDYQSQQPCSIGFIVNYIMANEDLDKYRGKLTNQAPFQMMEEADIRHCTHRCHEPIRKIRYHTAQRHNLPVVVRTHLPYQAVFLHQMPCQVSKHKTHQKKGNYHSDNFGKPGKDKSPE